MTAFTGLLANRNDTPASLRRFDERGGRGFPAFRSRTRSRESPVNPRACTNTCTFMAIR